MGLLLWVGTGGEEGSEDVIALSVRTMVDGRRLYLLKENRWLTVFLRCRAQCAAAQRGVGQRGQISGLSGGQVSSGEGSLGSGKLFHESLYHLLFRMGS